MNILKSLALIGMIAVPAVNSMDGGLGDIDERFAEHMYRRAIEGPYQPRVDEEQLRADLSSVAQKNPCLPACYDKARAIYSEDLNTYLQTLRNIESKGSTPESVQAKKATELKLQHNYFLVTKSIFYSEKAMNATIILNSRLDPISVDFSRVEDLQAQIGASCILGADMYSDAKYLRFKMQSYEQMDEKTKAFYDSFSRFKSQED